MGSWIIFYLYVERCRAIMGKVGENDGNKFSYKEKIKDDENVFCRKKCAGCTEFSLIPMCDLEL